MVITLLCIFVIIVGAILHYKFKDSWKYDSLDIGGCVCMLLGYLLVRCPGRSFCAGRGLR